MAKTKPPRERDATLDAPETAASEDRAAADRRGTFVAHTIAGVAARLYAWQPEQLVVMRARAEAAGWRQLDDIAAGPLAAKLVQIGWRGPRCHLLAPGPEGLARLASLPAAELEEAARAAAALNRLFGE